MSYTYLFLVLALLALALEPGPRLRVPRWLRNRLRSRRHRAGASAAAHARQLRTPAVRVADLLGIPTRRSRDAARWEAGAAGERKTARRLAELEREGWTVLHDRALPGSNANVDHLLISPTGVVIVADTKLWSARWPVTVSGGHLYHGALDVTDRLAGVRHEAAVVSKQLGIRAVPVVLLDGPPVPGPLRLYGIRIVPAADACAHLRAIARAHPARPADAALAARARRAFPPYRQGRR